ncbi:MAG: transposase [Sphingobacteriaceae bacterium]|nr:transposase [Sphingobacteriaceae bacterium]
MGERGYQIKDHEALHFITFATVQWVDVFTRKEYSDIVVESLIYCKENKGLRIHAWCIMSNHLHLILSVNENNNLSDVLRDFKKFTSSHIIKAIKNNTHESRRNWMLWIFKKAGEENKRNKDYQFWQQENHPVELSTNEMIDQRLNYLHDNPVRSGAVRTAEEYLYSSAIDYYTTESGLIGIDFIA